MRKSIFLDKAKTSVFHCRINQDLHERIQNVQTRLKERGDAVFPIDQIIEETLQRATRLAEAELTKRATAAPAT